MKKIIMAAMAVLGMIMGASGLAAPTVALGDATICKDATDPNGGQSLECNITASPTICDEITDPDDRQLLGCDITDAPTRAVGSAATVINIVLGILGLVAVGVVIGGGIMFMISVGDATRVKRARDMILYGLIGLGVALVAFALVNFVLVSIFK